MTPCSPRLGIDPNSAGLLVLALAFSSTLALMVRHATDYFFLLDDFALLGESSRQTGLEIASSALFRFYRPLVFLASKSEAYLFGWAVPQAYAFVSIVWHLLNTWLVWQLASAVGLHGLARTASATVFFVTAWAAESVLWVSGQFDLLSTLGVLAAMVAANKATSAPRASARTWTALAVLATAVGVFSKEGAVVTPALFVVLAQVDWRGANRRRAKLATAGALCLPVAGYLLIRQSILPDFGGAYGSLAELIRGVNITGQLAMFFSGLLLLVDPRGGPYGPLSIAVLVAPASAILSSAFLCLAILGNPRRATCLVAALIVSVVPVLWAPPSGRFLYQPGIWYALLLGSGLDYSLTTLRLSTRTARTAWVTGLGWLLASHVAAFATHAASWSRASNLSRQGIRQFEALVDQGIELVRITNLPHRCVEGPVVLTNYSFVYYYAGRQVPQVAFDAFLVSCRQRPVRFIGVVPSPAASSPVVSTAEPLAVTMTFD